MTLLTCNTYSFSYPKLRRTVGPSGDGDVVAYISAVVCCHDICSAGKVSPSDSIILKSVRIKNKVAVHGMVFLFLLVVVVSLSIFSIVIKMVLCVTIPMVSFGH